MVQGPVFQAESSPQKTKISFVLQPSIHTSILEITAFLTSGDDVNTFFSHFVVEYQNILKNWSLLDEEPKTVRLSSTGLDLQYFLQTVSTKLFLSDSSISNPVHLVPNVLPRWHFLSAVHCLHVEHRLTWERFLHPSTQRFSSSSSSPGAFVHRPWQLSSVWTVDPGGRPGTVHLTSSHIVLCDRWSLSIKSVKRNTCPTRNSPKRIDEVLSIYQGTRTNSRNCFFLFVDLLLFIFLIQKQSETTWCKHISFEAPPPTPLRLSCHKHNFTPNIFADIYHLFYGGFRIWCHLE